MKIMIVDDNRQMRNFLKSYFAAPGIEIAECENGLEALESFGSVNPEYVFMDIKMPVMDGIEATKKIVLSFPKAKIVIVTEYDDEHLRDEADKAGACEYILKDNLSTLYKFNLV